MGIVSIEKLAVLRANKLYAQLIESLDKLDIALSDLAVRQAKLEAAKLDLSIKLRKLEWEIINKTVRYDRAGT